MVSLRAWMVLLSLVLPLSAAEPGATRIATWRGDATAAFLLMFDDSCPSHWQMALPALSERTLIGTFYINAGKAEFTKFRGKWEKDMQQAGMVLGNHTMTHQGVRDLANAREEIGGCTKVLYELQPAPAPRLISFAMPGVGPGKWNITGAEMKAVLAENHLIDRPPFNDHGAVYALKTVDQMLALADRAIAAKGMEYLVIHGIERRGIDWGYQDFWALNLDVFKSLLDGVRDRRDRGDLWVTDHISWYRYKAEREQATVTGRNAGADRLEITLACTTDPALYDLPLTLVTTVPAAWKRVAVAQVATAPVVVEVRNGEVRYDAAPNGGAIALTPAP